MHEDQFIKLPRELLYNEIWQISVSGVSKKYKVPYSELLRLCKETDIPIPPSGYWTKLNYGKPVEQISLPESELNDVILPTNVIPKRKKRSTTSKPAIDIKEQNTSIETNDDKSGHIEQIKGANQLEEVIPDEIHTNQIPYRTVDGERNVYNRDKLYEEVWAKPVISVAVQYGVSDVAIHKICKSLNVPVPPRGYWAKLRAGEKMNKTPLPPAKGITEKTGFKTFEGVKEPNAPQQVLSFLPEEEREKVLLAAQEIQMSAENALVHKKINVYKSVIKEWNKKDIKSEGAKRDYKYFTHTPPFLAGVISDEALPRVFRILDALFRQVEKLGGSVNDDLSLNIRNENVEIEIAESQDVVDHVMTKQEAQALLAYKDAKRRNSWASEPQIRKHDYVFNGRLRICIREHRYFRDSDKVNIEAKLGEMLIELYEKSEVVRKNREAYEEAERKKNEEKRLKEERKIRYNEEVEKTTALINIVQDYDFACKIRAYVSALEAMEDKDEKIITLIDWAKKKADWFDPTVARTDEILGDRDYEESQERKRLEKRYYW